MAERIEWLDSRRFAGRREVLDPIEALLATAGSGAVIFVHGPGGVGKSALLREIGRRALGHGRPVQVVDGRQFAQLPTELAGPALVAACADSQRHPRPVLLLDSFDRMNALAEVLRDQVLLALPATAIVIIAGRRRPAALWFRDGWEHVVQDVVLRARPEHEPEPPPVVLAEPADVVRSALRAFHDPVRLAASPLAAGDDIAERATSVRIRLRAAIDAVFGTTSTEQSLRRLVQRAYLDADGGHRRAMTEEHLARSSYFRRLNDAISRIELALEPDRGQVLTMVAPTETADRSR